MILSIIEFCFFSTKELCTSTVYDNENFPPIISQQGFQYQILHF